MNVLVTGGSGFIGSFLVDLLVSNKYEVTIFDNNAPQYGLCHKAVYIKGNITEKKYVEHAMEGQDYVVHLAGPLGTHELVEYAFDATNVNIGGTIRVLDACRRYGVQLISISKPNCWLNPYTITKIASEQYIEMYRREFSVQAVVIKWFNVYGGRQPLFNEKGYRKAVPTWVVDALSGRDIEIYGNGHQTMDRIYISDAINAVISVMKYWNESEGCVFEVGSGSEISANDLAEIIRIVTKSTSIIKHLPMRPGEDNDTRIKADISMIIDRTHWLPRISLEEGIKRTVDWYKEYSV